MGSPNPGSTPAFRPVSSVTLPTFSPKQSESVELDSAPRRHWLDVSWSRSRAALGEIDEPSAAYVQQVPADSTLLRAAKSVLANLAAAIEDEPVSLILIDAKGTVLSRSGGDAQLLAALDSVDLAPGFRYSESQVGTNGIGTALEVGSSLVIDGAQHFSGQLRSFSCAGALVTHPVTGVVLGVVDLTTKAENSNALLLSFAKLAAARIRERIIEYSNESERALLRDYHLASRHSGRPVIAIGEEVLMINSLTQQKFDSRDQAAIIEHIRDARGRSDAFTLLTDLPSGGTARLSYQPTFVEDHLAGGIVRIADQVAGRGISPSHTPSLPAIPGDSAIWRHTVHDIVDACRRREWLVLEGEAGVGKTSLIRAVHEYVSRTNHLAVLDAHLLEIDELLELAAAELDGGSDLAILHTHTLAGADLEALGELLQSTAPGVLADDPWVVLTTQPQESSQTSSLLRLFPKSVSVPALRHHLEDIPALVRMLLGEAGATGLSLSPAALNQLMRLAWRGNVTQLRAVLDEIFRSRRSGVIELGGLPAQCRATTRRKLSTLQSLERDAIVDALAINTGDKTAAAQALGMSRATIYRKIREFGIAY